MWYFFAGAGLATLWVLMYILTGIEYDIKLIRKVMERSNDE